MPQPFATLDDKRRVRSVYVPEPSRAGVSNYCCLASGGIFCNSRVRLLTRTFRDTLQSTQQLPRVNTRKSHHRRSNCWSAIVVLSVIRHRHFDVAASYFNLDRRNFSVSSHCTSQRYLKKNAQRNQELLMYNYASKQNGRNFNMAIINCMNGQATCTVTCMVTSLTCTATCTITHGATNRIRMSAKLITESV